MPPNIFGRPHPNLRHTYVPRAQLSLDYAARTYRNECLVEAGMLQLQGAPLLLTAIPVERDDHHTGVTLLFCLELRLVTLPQVVARQLPTG